jgi:hypothetical protein
VISKGHVEFDSEKITWDVFSKALRNRGCTEVKTR